MVTINKIKNNKTSGEDEIITNMVKEGESKTDKLINECLTTGKMSKR